MPEVAPVPEFAVMMGPEIPALLGFQNGLADVQIVDSVGEKASFPVPAVPVFHERPAQLDFVFAGLLARAVGGR